MGQVKKPYFEVVCMKHGEHKMGYGKIDRFLKVAFRGKRRQCCPLCRKEYIKKHNIKKPEIIDWRYIQFN